MIEENHRMECKTISDIASKLRGAVMAATLLTIMHGDDPKHYPAACNALLKTITEVLEDMDKIFGKEIIYGTDTGKDNIEEA